MNEKRAEFKIEIDEPTARGTYTNLAFISHSETEFVMDFTFLQPNQPHAKVSSRLITSPLHAKRFIEALKDNVRKYEERFGPIKDDAPSVKPGEYYQ